MTAPASESDTKFVEAHRSLVEGCARQLQRQLDLRCEVDDLVAFGYAGLLEARGRFDASKGIRFAAYAHYRVRGAILDGVRQMAYLPRRAHARMKAVQALDEEAELLGEARASAKRGPVEGTTRAQAARALDGVLGRVAAAYCVAAAANEAENGSESGSPEQVVLRGQQRSRLLKALSQLPERERFVVEGHYLGDRSIEVLGAELGLSKSWASRLHSRGLERLRRVLAED